MSERTPCYVRMDGEVLFQMPALSRRMGEGDTFTVMLDGSSVTYKVETVDYRLYQTASQERKVWQKSEVHYGVSVVP